MTETIKPVKHRIESIDILRGLVMLIMAIDHVRDCFHLSHPEPTDLAITTPILFFTRWITHFCAPTFVFLSGISAYLASSRRTGNEASAFLFKRGLWLIIVEVTLITFGITLNPFFNVIILQVIWAIGGSMILLALLVRLKASIKIIGIIGLIIVFGHNIFDIVNPGAVTKTLPWALLVSASGFGGFIKIGDNQFLLAAYALLPWTGVMLVGYVFGTLYKAGAKAVKRQKTLLYSGLGLLAMFFIFRAFNIYGDPSPWSVQKTFALSVISFFNVTKYPCSLLYLGMTVGTSLVLLSCIEGVQNKFIKILIIYGNVPFFYYLCHWYLIQIFHIVLFFAMGFTTSQVVSPNQPFLFSPEKFGVNLLGVYVIWLMIISILYLPCKWFSRYKKAHGQWWLSYI